MAFGKIKGKGLIGRPIRAGGNTNGRYATDMQQSFDALLLTNRRHVPGALDIYLGLNPAEGLPINYVGGRVNNPILSLRGAAQSFGVRHVSDRMIQLQAFKPRE